MDMKYQSLESLPLALSVDDLMDILNIGKKDIGQQGSLSAHVSSVK